MGPARRLQLRIDLAPSKVQAALRKMTRLVSVVALVVMAACALALPSSLMNDVKQAEMTHSRLTNKVKRAQEVIMFGNQQNRGGDGHGGFATLPRTEKRGVDIDENVLSEVTERPRVLDAEALEEPKVMALFDRPEPDYATRLHNAILKPEYYGDPAALADMRFYELDERRKRETFRTPSKRSSRGLSMGTGRAKRDLDLDPEELLALLSYWESETRRNKLQHQNRNMYGQFNVMDSDDMEVMDNAENGNELTEEEEPKQDGWMDGPVAVPSRHFSVGSEPWGRHRISDDRRKRFMVSKRRSQDSGDIYSLAQLLNGPQRDVGGGFAYRRRRYAS